MKAFLRDRFSLGVFALSQGVIDVESVVNILRGNWPVHAHLHTLPGALAVSAACALVGPSIVNPAYRWLAARGGDGVALPAWAHGEMRPVGWTASIVGALFGGLSHVALDGMMHPDMAPLAPWTAGNPLLLPHAFLAIHLACAVVGALGLAAWVRRAQTT